MRHATNSADSRQDELRPETIFDPFYPEDNTVNLISELHRRGYHRQARRLESCLKHHRPDFRDPSDVRRTFQTCGLVCCRYCIRKQRHRWRTGKLMRRAFADAKNKDASLVTIHCMGRTMHALMIENRGFREEIRALRRQWCRTCPNAAQISFEAILEVSGEPTGEFRGHWHMIVYHPGFCRTELLQTLRHKWPCSHRESGRRVNIRPLWMDQSFQRNADHVLFTYALKANLSDGRPRFPNVRSAAEYWIHLMGRGGLKRLITVIGSSPRRGCASPNNVPST